MEKTDESGLTLFILPVRPFHPFASLSPLQFRSSIPPGAGVKVEDISS